MSNATLPTLPGFRYPVKRRPLWSGKVQTALSGKETRLSYWSFPRYRYTIGYEVLRSDSSNAELAALIGFYNARQGQFDDWLFNDPDDNSVTLQQFGVGDGVTTSFQLVRAFGGFTEPVTALNAPGGVPIYANGVATGGVSVTASGLVTFTNAPAAGVLLSATFAYYWRVRFDDIDLTLDKLMGGLWQSGDIAFTTTK